MAQLPHLWGHLQFLFSGGSSLKVTQLYHHTAIKFLREGGNYKLYAMHSPLGSFLVFSTSSENDFTKYFSIEKIAQYYTGLHGAMVARLTPDQKAACSNHVGVINILKYNSKGKYYSCILSLLLGNILYDVNRKCLNSSSRKIT